MDPHRKFWNDQQKELRQALEGGKDAPKAVSLFLDHHAMVHSSRLAKTGLWSFEDEALEGLEPYDFRLIPDHEDHSIAWILWHLARIEDVTMNLLVAGRPQVFQEGKWQAEIMLDSVETGNALDRAGIERLSTTINVEALAEYRLAVGRRTREIISALSMADFTQRVDPQRFAEVLASGAVVESTRWLADYWGKRTIAGLLLMPPTRHNFIHLTEAVEIQKRIGRQAVGDVQRPAKGINRGSDSKML